MGVLGRLNLDTGKMMDHVKFETGNMVGLAINDGGKGGPKPTRIRSPNI